VDEAIDDDVAGAYRQVMEIALHDNVFSSLNFGFTA